MSTSTVVRARFDYKYSANDWRKDAVETFQPVRKVGTRYTVADGHLVRTIETTREFASAEAQVAADPIAGPPYFYADGKYHADVAQIFQTTRIKTTTYEDYSATSYQITIDDFDVLLNKHTITRQVIDGKIPLAPTVRSSFTNLIQKPLVGTIDHKCAWVDNTTPLDLPWAEDDEDMGKAGRRQAQRDSAIVRKITIPSNALVQPGHTARLVHAVRDIDANHMIVSKQTRYESKDATLKDDLGLEYWEH
jgi:hypothetical protein